jgi:hypothetical protein
MTLQQFQDAFTIAKDFNRDLSEVDNMHSVWIWFARVQTGAYDVGNAVAKTIRCKCASIQRAMGF